jgi:colicin import membrane protein
VAIGAAASRDLFMPRPPGGTGRGIVLALLVHGLLVAGLAIGVNWRTGNPQAVQAELWAAVPQVAAPRAASPEPPTPRAEPEPPKPKPRPVEPERPTPPQAARPDPQIAIEKARREERERRLEEQREQEAKKKEAARKLELAQKEKEREKERERERERADADKRRKEQEAEREREKKERAEATRLAEAREAAVRRMLNQAGGASGEVGSTGSAAQSAAPSAGYQGRVIARIKPNIVFVDDLATNPEAEVLVRLAPDGRILSQKLTRSSGVKEWDQAVQRAIERTEVLPRDVDGRVPASMVISFRPRE